MVILQWFLLFLNYSSPCVSSNLRLLPPHGQPWHVVFLATVCQLRRLTSMKSLLSGLRLRWDWIIEIYPEFFAAGSDKKKPSQHVFHWKSPPLFHGKCWLRCIFQCIFDILSARTFVLSLILQVAYKSSALIDTNLHQTRKEFPGIDTLLASFPRYRNQLCTAWLPILVFLLGKLFFLANCFMASKRLHP